ncbi:putative oligomerization/nucleic acid binding protein [Nocardiopsis sp. Huas11]|uniref:DUF4429 domain-containing protein n=1 Tax=Nocardiopsis sp. Huas11 TaxID=2183912 RepID=UPI000EAFE979|nr:DUF4429 domain-containing protein [Nocardiopsis sp. Huas11]RKS10454.1 putative oligomerization/nucleic acid binding protein [Nocardiopsis sp. Huas11]
MEELRGHHGTWRLDDEMVRIRFDSGRKVPTLFKSLGSCAVPLAAVTDVEFDQVDRKRGWRLRLRLAEGTDPYAQLGGPGSEAPTPLVLTGPHDKELLAEYFSDQLAAAARYARELCERAPEPAEVAKGLVARPPVQVRTAEGSASFDGTRVRLQWDGWLSSTAKEREKSREYRLSEIESATWYPPVDVTEGHLRIVLRGVTIPEATELENDFFTLASHGTKGGEETLLMAATLNAHIQPVEAAAEEAAALAPVPGVSAEEESVFAKIRELGRLHAEGLLTDEEFSAKKAELLDRL